MWRMLGLALVVVMGGCAAGGVGGGSGRPVAGVRTVETQRTMVQSAETMVPYSDVLTYDRNWVETSRRRGAGE
jgi:hypothetical protein